MFLAAALLCTPAETAEPLFITIDRVALKSISGEWVTVIRPDKRLDLTQEEPVVRFFNNGRIPAGEYSNVRVEFTAEHAPSKKMVLERAQDYRPSLPVKKGTFIGVTLSFDWEKARDFSSGSVKEVRLVVDQAERVDGGDKINLWS